MKPAHLTIDYDGLQLQPIVTSHSIDGTMEFCPRKFEFAHIWSQVPEGGNTGFAAEVGTALHEAVQAWARISLLPGRDRTTRSQFAYDVGVRALLQWWPWSLEQTAGALGKQGVKQRSLGEAILLYEKIIESAFWDSWDLIAIDDKFGLSIEVPYRINHNSIPLVPLPNGKLGHFVTQGKIDFILRNRFTGEIRVFDLKTTVKEKTAHEAAFRWSGQGPGYALVISAGLGFDWREHGFKVSYIVATFASADGFEDAEVNLYTYDYSPDDIQDGIDLKHDRLMRMYTYAQRQHWPRRAHGCDSFGSHCQYLKVCAHRDVNFIEKWFLFERFEQRTRIYEPIWELDA